MPRRYVVELVDGPSTHYGFAYIDTEDNLAALIFDHLKMDVLTDLVYQLDEDDPYRVVLVRIPRTQREAFLHAIDLLPAFMAYAGKEDYEEYCRAFFTKAGRWLNGQGAAERSTLLQ